MKLTDHVRNLNARLLLFQDVTSYIGGGPTKIDGIATRATGTITFTPNPTAGDTITLNSTIWSFVASGATGNQTNIQGGGLAATLTQLAIDLNASADAEVSKCTYSVSATVLTIAYDNGDSAANDFTIAASVATVSGPNLIGGLDFGDATSGGVICPVVIADVMSYYRFRSGTDAESSPVIIRPDDYAATVHERVWELVAISGVGAGTVTSVAMTVPTGFSVTGTPITTGGTLAVTENTQAANKVKAGPTSGGSATPAYRSLVMADLPAGVIGGATYQGTWNASTNSPALASGVGTAGFWYKVSVAGTTTIDTVSEWNVGDMIIFDGTVWDKIDNTAEDATTSLKGTVKLAQDLGGTAALPVVLQASQAFALSGIISPAQIVANTNDYNPTGLSTATILRLNTDAARNLTGIAGGAAGRIIVLENIGSFNITLINLATSSAGNQFSMGYNLALLPNQSIAFWYDATSTKWRPLQLRGIINDTGLAALIGVSSSADASLLVVGPSVSANTGPGTLLVVCQTGNTTNTYFGTKDFNPNSSVGSCLLLDFGAATGDTYARLSALHSGNNAWDNLILQSGGGGVVLGATSLTSGVKLDVIGRVRAKNYVAATATKTPSATPVFDLDAEEEETMSVTAAITGMTTSNRGDGKKKTIWLVSDGTSRALAVNASWIPIGTAIDATLAVGKTAILSIHCKGSGEANVYYAYRVQP